MKKYNKIHSSKKAAENHLKKIRGRGGIAETKSVRGGGIQIDYYFPENKAPKLRAKSAGKMRKDPSAKKASKKAELYDVLSPDGFTIRIGVPLFKSVKERDAYFEQWKERFRHQGYYSYNFQRIPLDQLRSHCKFVQGKDIPPFS